MGLAIDTVASTALNPSTTVTATTIVTGDTFTVRNFAPADQAKLWAVIRRGATSGQAGVRSPLFHDNVRGFRYTSAQTVSMFAVPLEAGQPLQPQDTLIVEITGGAAETDAIYHSIYYTNLLGVSARLHNWSELSGNIRSLKSLQVAVTNSATIGAWTDTVFTTTENLLHADSDYAVLGYITDTVQGAVGVKGQETGNLRICGPGTTDSSDTSDYFVRLNLLHNMPTIPVINANNRSGLFVCTSDVVASSTPNVTLILAELSVLFTS